MAAAYPRQMDLEFDLIVLMGALVQHLLLFLYVWLPLAFEGENLEVREKENGECASTMTRMEQLFHVELAIRPLLLHP
eukprot:scaffold161880_cov28-Tisochrysis_lutea.AAC.1